MLTMTATLFSNQFSHYKIFNEVAYIFEKMADIRFWYFSDWKLCKNKTKGDRHLKCGLMSYNQC